MEYDQFFLLRIMDRDRATAEVENLFDECYPYLIRYGGRLCRERAVVEDCIQQAMLLLFRELRRGTDVPNPKAWVLLVLRRELLRSLRRDRIHVVLTNDPVVNPVSGDFDSAPVVPESIESFLGLLSPREAEVLLLRIDGLKYREIARALKISGNSVNQFLSRAVEKIRAWRSADQAKRTEIRQTRSRQRGIKR
jgi:RNA polymerase sigma factor (sigma-70 family)